ncbi:unnamed protein product [Protopolystoma xenopodis]|uniref:Uncharacterized protein n=1 Tax=Protopolystoma xenopodis TaxID=117903 RepID=A0A3S5CDZ0_9PLAT|nr:unnamed protein product [Protopolystoma xenopodis]
MCISNFLLLSLVSQHNKRVFAGKDSSTLRGACKTEVVKYVSVSTRDKQKETQINSSFQSKCHETRLNVQNTDSLESTNIKNTDGTNISDFQIMDKEKQQDQEEIPIAFTYHKIYRSFGFCTNINTCASYDVTRMATKCLAALAFSSTFFVYLLLNSHYRDCFKEVFCNYKNALAENPDNLINETTVFATNSNKKAQPAEEGVLSFTFLKGESHMNASWKNRHYI